MSEWCGRTSERSSERPSTLYVDSIVISPIVGYEIDAESKYWSIRSSTHWFTSTAYLLSCFALLAFLACSAALIRSHTHSLVSETMGKRFLSMK